MNEPASADSHRNGTGTVRFGVFDANLRAGELRKGGVKIKLHGQAFCVLAALLERPGQVVTREELQQKLWTSDTFVDFEQGLNKAINKIREALGDAAENPRFVETLPKRGYRFIAPVAVEETEVSGGQLPPVAPGAALARPWRRWALSFVAGAFAIATAVMALLYFHQKAPAGQVLRFEIPIHEKLSGVGSFALSPDGRELAFIGEDANGQSYLWVRSLVTLESRLLNGTEDVYGFPFWSPDSRFVAFAAGDKLKKIDVSGGPPMTLCNAHPVWGGSWGPGDTIVFGSEVGIQQVSASGGPATPVTASALSATPTFLPDGRHFIFMRVDPAGKNNGFYLGSIDLRPEEQPSRELLAADSNVVLGPSSDPAVVYVLFVRGAKGVGSIGTLMAQRLNTRHLELTGDAQPIAERVANVAFSASSTGSLIYVAQSPIVPPSGAQGAVEGQLTWLSREGKVLGHFGEEGIYRALTISPDGKQLAFERFDPQGPSMYSLWLHDFERGATTRFTFNSDCAPDPVWSPDGSRIAFGLKRTMGVIDMYEKVSNLAGQEELLFESKDDKLPTSWSPDGKFLLYTAVAPLPLQLWVLPVETAGTAREPIPIERSEFNEIDGKFSPNGRWIAYFSDESGTNEVYVRAFDVSSARVTRAGKDAPAAGKWMVSKDGGTSPLWRHDGKELFYLSPDGTAMAVELNPGAAFQAGIPKALFKVPPGVIFWDVSPDGKRFLMASPSANSASAQVPFTVVLNWPSLLKE